MKVKWQVDGDECTAYNGFTIEKLVRCQRTNFSNQNQKLWIWFGAMLRFSGVRKVQVSAPRMDPTLAQRVVSKSFLFHNFKQFEKNFFLRVALVRCQRTKST